MKTNTQIEMAQETIKRLQDYIELAKVEKKLKVDANKDNISKMIDDIVSATKEFVNEL